MLTSSYSDILMSSNHYIFRGLVERNSLYKENQCLFIQNLLQEIALINKPLNRLAILESLRKFLLKKISEELIFNLISQNKKLNLLFLKVMLCDENSFKYYVKTKQKGLLDNVEPDEFLKYDNSFRCNISYDYLNNADQDFIKERLFWFIENDIDSSIAFAYLKYSLDKKHIITGMIIDKILESSQPNEMKMVFLNYCSLRKMEFISCLKKRKKAFHALLKDDFNYIEKSHCLPFIIDYLKSDYSECMIISAGLKTNTFKEMLSKYEFDEIKSMLKVFRGNYPLLFEKIYVQNKCIRKSKVGKVRTTFEKLLIEINMENLVSKSSLERRKRM